jgi:hypothetical protein
MRQIFLNFGRILGYRKTHDFSRFNINICDDDDDDDIYIYIFIYGYIIKPSPRKTLIGSEQGKKHLRHLFMLNAFRLTRGVLFAGFPVVSLQLSSVFFFPI